MDNKWKLSKERDKALKLLQDRLIAAYAVLGKHISKTLHARLADIISNGGPDELDSAQKAIFKAIGEESWGAAIDWASHGR